MRIDAKKAQPLVIGLLCVAAFIAALAVRFTDRSSGPKITPQEGRVFAPPMEIPAFSLVDHFGKPFTNERLRGHWTLATIGFTYCPDVCPLTLAKVAEFYELLDKAGLSQVRPKKVFFSVDPFRDAQDVLADYVTFYRPEFLGVTGSPEDIAHAVDGLGLHYAYADPGGKTIFHDVLHRPGIAKYSVIHSTQLLFINPEGEVAAMIMQPFTPARLLTIYTMLRRSDGGK